VAVPGEAASGLSDSWERSTRGAAVPVPSCELRSSLEKKGLGAAPFSRAPRTAAPCRRICLQARPTQRTSPRLPRVFSMLHHRLAPDRCSALLLE
jgi:hypothetical protein